MRINTGSGNIAHLGILPHSQHKFACPFQMQVGQKCMGSFNLNLHLAKPSRGHRNFYFLLLDGAQNDNTRVLHFITESQLDYVKGSFILEQKRKLRRSR